jgi:hypothetical protein
VLLWLLWLGSVLATAVAYAGTMVGAFALPSGIPDIWDLALPLLMCIVEFLLFAVLIRQVTSFASLNSLVSTWLGPMALFGAVALLSITRAPRHFTGAARAVGEDAAVAIERYTKYLDRDRLGASATCAVSTIATIVRLAGGTAVPMAYLFAAAVILLLGAGVNGHGQTARMWRLRLYPELGDSRSGGEKTDEEHTDLSRQQSRGPHAAEQSDPARSDDPESGDKFRVSAHTPVSNRSDGPAELDCAAVLKTAAIPPSGIRPASPRL